MGGNILLPSVDDFKQFSKRWYRLAALTAVWMATHFGKVCLVEVCSGMVVAVTTFSMANELEHLLICPLFLSGSPP